MDFNDSGYTLKAEIYKIVEDKKFNLPFDVKVIPEVNSVDVNCSFPLKIIIKANNLEKTDNNKIFCMKFSISNSTNKYYDNLNFELNCLIEDLDSNANNKNSPLSKKPLYKKYYYLLPRFKQLYDVSGIDDERLLRSLYKAEGNLDKVLEYLLE